MSSSDNRQIPQPNLRSILPLFAAISLPLLAVTALISVLFYRFEAANHLEIIGNKEISIVSSAQRLIRDSIAPILHDLDFLAELTQTALATRTAGEDFSPDLLQQLMPVFQTYGTTHGDLDQIRVIDRDGNEQLRIDNGGETSTIVPKEELQNKAHQYYFIDTMRLEPATRYMSPLDLNIEHGAIEHPLKPIIRFGKVVINREGEKAGMVMINYTAQAMLKNLRDWSHPQKGDLLLLNREGYYLHHPDEQQEWGFMLPERSGWNFGFQYPDVWRNHIQKYPGGQTTYRGKTFTFTTISPLSPATDIISSTGSPQTSGQSIRAIPPGEYNWTIVSVTTPLLLYESLQEFRRTSVAVAAAAMSLLTVLAWFLAKNHVSRKLGEKALRELHDQLERKVTLRTRELYDRNLQLSQEVEDRKAIERKLVKSEEQYEAIMEAMDDGVCIVSQGRRLIYCNPAMQRRIGAYNEQDPCYKILYSRQTICPWCNLDAVLQGQKSHYELTSDTNGRLYHISDNLIRLGDNKIGRLTISRDITQTRHTENALGRTERYFSTLLNTMREALVAANLDGRVTYCNQQFAEMVGHRQEEILDSLLADFVAPESRQNLLDNLKKRKEKKVDPYEMTWAGPDEKKILTTVSPALLFNDNGELTGSFAIISDITAIRHEEKLRRDLENQLQQAQKMEALGTLAGGIAHDFNNILTAIMGYSSLALEEKDSPQKVRNCLKEINIAGSRAVQLVGQILSFSRQSVKEKRPLEIVPIVKEALKLIRTAIPLSLTIEIDNRGDLLRVLADPTQIHQIIMNLCTNSYQAIGDKSGTLNLLVERVSLDEDGKIQQLKTGDYVHIQARDDGPGIPEQMLPQIFDPFFTTKEAGGGTGLGLSVVRSIVENLSGAIEVASNEGVGTTFDIYLPLCMQDREKRADEAKELFLGSGQDIIWLDDEMPLVRLGCQILKILGYKPVGFSDVTSCLEEISNNPEKYGVLITDYNMPIMTGLELAGKVKQINPDINIILCTGFSDVVTPDNAWEYGIHDYLLKPVHKHDIAKAVYDAFDSTPPADM